MDTLDRVHLFNKSNAFIYFIEKNYPIEDWTINNVKVWPLIRLTLTDVNLAAQDKVPKPNHPIVYFGGLKRLIVKVCHLINEIIFWEKTNIRDYEANDHTLQQKDVLILGYDNYRKTVIDSKFYFTEILPFLKNIGCDSYFILEATIGRCFRMPRLEKSLLFQRNFFYRHLGKKLKGLLWKKEPVVNSDVNFDYEILKKHALAHGIFMPTIEKYIQDVNFIHELAEYFEEIINIIQPKMILTEWYYGVYGLALIFAAKRKGIPVADLQHGCIYSNHYAYGKWKPVSEGYELLPDYFFVWSDFEKEIIEQWSEKCNGKHKPLVIGNIGQKYIVEKMNAFYKEKDILVNKMWSGAQKHILFTMDHWFPDDYIIDFINASPEKWQWWIRMHPVAKARHALFVKMFNKKIHREHINIIEATNVPLPVLLSIMDLHITRCSSVVREALEFGVPSIIEYADIMEGLENSSGMFLIKKISDVSAEEISKLFETGIHHMNNKRELGESALVGIEYIKRFLLHYE